MKANSSAVISRSSSSFLSNAASAVQSVEGADLTEGEAALLLIDALSHIVSGEMPRMVEPPCKHSERQLIHRCHAVVLQGFLASLSLSHQTNTALKQHHCFLTQTIVCNNGRVHILAAIMRSSKRNACLVLQVKDLCIYQLNRLFSLHAITWHGRCSDSSALCGSPSDAFLRRLLKKVRRSLSLAGLPA